MGPENQNEVGLEHGRWLLGGLCPGEGEVGQIMASHLESPIEKRDVWRTTGLVHHRSPSQRWLVHAQITRVGGSARSVTDVHRCTDHGFLFHWADHRGEHGNAFAVKGFTLLLS